MKCEKIEELILSMPDGGLTAEERASLEDHIAVCPRCRELYDTVRTVSAELKAEPELPSGLHDEIMSAVRCDKRAKKPTVIRLRRYLAAAACFAVVVAAAGTVIGGMFRCGSAAPSSNMTAAADMALEKSPQDNGMFFAENEGVSAEAPETASGDAAEPPEEYVTDSTHTLTPPTPEPELLPDIAEAELESVTDGGETEAHLTSAEVQVFLDALFDGSLSENDASYTLHITESDGSEYTLYLTLTDGVIAMSLTPGDPDPIPVASIPELAELISELK